jgi:hypothetical protein
MNKARANGILDLEAYLAGHEFAVNSPLYTEPANPTQVVVDQVIYYERLIADLGTLFGKLGIPFHGTLGVNAKSDYRADRRPYQDVYTPDQARRIAKVFKDEIRLHGYTFWGATVE